MKPTEKKQSHDSSKEQEYLEGWKRARADLENMQKRLSETRMRDQVTLKRSVAESLIPLHDNFKSLVSHAPTETTPWIDGVLHIARQFDQILQDFGIEMIEQTGIPFDPNIHEAVEEVKEGKESGVVSRVVQAGYKIGDSVIRPAKVSITS